MTELFLRFHEILLIFPKDASKGAILFNIQKGPKKGEKGANRRIISFLANCIKKAKCQP